MKTETLHGFLVAGTMLLALILSANDLRACTASVSTSLSGPILTVTVTQGGTCFYNNLQRSSVLVGMQPDNTFLFESGCPSGEASCTLTRSFNRACLPTGNHTVIADVTCGEGPDNACTRQTTRATSTFFFNSKPEVSLSHTGPDSSGNLRVDMLYTYPNNSSGRLFLDVFDANGHGMWGYEWQFQGEPGRSFDINTQCWPNGEYTVKAQASSCGHPKEDPNATGTDEFTFSVQSTPTVVTPVLELQDDGMIGGSVNYTFPASSTPQNRGIELRWQGTDALIDATAPGELTAAAGSWVINPFSCPSERGMKVYAIPNPA